MRSSPALSRITLYLANLKTKAGRSLTKESGQSMVIVVFAMTAMLGMMALAIDGGMAYALHSRMQTAADTAALSGAREMAMGSSNITALNRATQILTANGADPKLSSATIAASHQVKVIATTHYDTLFAGIMGIRQMTISAKSAAAWGGVVVAAAGNVMPLAVPDDLWRIGDSVTLQNSDAGAGPGNWGWVKWGMGNLITNITPPLSQITTPTGQWISVETGVTANVISAMDTYWKGKTVTVFLYDNTNGMTGNNMTYHVSGFAQFKITDVRASGNPKYITGTFVSYVQLGGIINPSVTRGNMGVALIPYTP